MIIHCLWRCYGSVVKVDNTFLIKTLVEPHTCARSMDNLLVGSKWIAKQYLNVFRMRKNFIIEDLRADILKRYNCHVNNSCWSCCILV